MGRGVAFIDRTFYPAVGDHWDADLFRDRIERHLTATSSILDFGAGRGALPQMNLRGESAMRFVAGVDVDDAVFGNPYLSEAKRLDASGDIPYAAERFDVVLAHNVLEHLPDPAATFREIHRVLKPGGVFVSKTPNRRHYVPLIARLTPHAFHIWINHRRGRNEEDTFPTLYRANTPRRIALLARRAGFSVEHIELFEGRPEYLRQNAVTYLAGLLFERFVNASPALRGWRVLMVSTLRKRPR